MGGVGLPEPEPEPEREPEPDREPEPEREPKPGPKPRVQGSGVRGQGSDPGAAVTMADLESLVKMTG